MRQSHEDWNVVIGVETARKAAHWWAEHLTGYDYDFPDLPKCGISPIPNPTPEQHRLFEEHLTWVLLEHHPRAVGVDYEPDELIDTALEKAGVIWRRGAYQLPTKTVMVFDEPGKVLLKWGYGARFEEL